MNNINNQFLLMVNKILRLMFNISTKFFTSWMLFFHILYYLNIIKDFQFSLLLLSFVVSIGGFIITYIYPKKVIIPNTNIIIDGIILKMFDILFHHIPLLLLLFVYNNKIKKDNLILATLIVFFYLVVNNPLKIYFFC